MGSGFGSFTRGGRLFVAEKKESSSRNRKIRAKKETSRGSEKTVIKSLGLSGGMFGAAPCAVDVKDGRIVRIRPMHYDWRYDLKVTRSNRTLAAKPS